MSTRRVDPGRSQFLLLMAAIVLGTAACGGSSTGAAVPDAPPGLADATRAAAPELGGGVLVVVSGAAAGPVGSDADHVVWESGPLETDSIQPVLHDRVLSTGKTTTIARKVDPLYGVASTTRSVFFARTAPGGTQLLRVSHGGGRSRVLTGSLAAPIASRGDVVAWAEETDASQRVVAMNARTGRQWEVASMPRCTVSGCYHIGAVTVSDAGIVFTRDAVGQQPSQVVRRGFADEALESIDIVDDPQPDLVPSSTGALYYVLSRGWYRWDFGERDAQPVAFDGGPTTRLLRFEDGRFYSLTRMGCSYRIETRAADGTGVRSLVTPEGLRDGARAPAGACKQLASFAWTGRQPLTAWAIAWASAAARHEDEGLSGAVVAGRLAV
jgi:hypothetical protein